MPERALTLVEVMFASSILTMVLCGVLQGMLQSRRMTEGSIRQGTVASVAQGYMEQIKSLKYAATLNALPSSPSTTPTGGTIADWQAYVGTPGTDDNNPTLTLKDSNQADTTICLVPGAAPTTLPDVSTLPTNAAKHSESVDIDNVNSTSDNCTLDMWVWINPMTGTNLQDCKSIVIVYQYTVKDGGRIRYFTDMIRTVRSIIPTDG
jgi:type II secretory pathway pseudopilin PulG